MVVGSDWRRMREGVGGGGKETKRRREEGERRKEEERTYWLFSDTDLI